MDRIRTGVAALDMILGGGFPRNSINLICGAPGTGKSILAQQMAFANAGPGCRAFYLTTLSEPFEKTVHYLQEMAFYREDRLLESILYRDLADELLTGGVEGLIDVVISLVKEERPRLLVIDSFKAVSDVAASKAEFRGKLFELARLLSAYSCTSFWVGEYTSAGAGQPEFAIADGILEMVNQKRGTRDDRYLRVVKLRGSTYLSGEHAFRVTVGGLEVFPRSCAVAAAPVAAAGAERVSSGFAALDGMLAGGPLRGSTTLVLGPSGVGKTILGLQFAGAVARRGEGSVLVSLQETPQNLRRTAGAVGIDLAGSDEAQVHILYLSPVDVMIDEVVFRLVEALERTGSRFVLVDALGELAAASWDEARYYGYVYSLAQAVKALGVTTVFNYELREQFDVNRLTPDAISDIADNVITLLYTRGETLGRVMRVVKARATPHSSTQIPYRIGPGGLSPVESVERG